MGMIGGIGDEGGIGNPSFSSKTGTAFRAGRRGDALDAAMSSTEACDDEAEDIGGVLN